MARSLVTLIVTLALSSRAGSLSGGTPSVFKIEWNPDRQGSVLDRNAVTLSGHVLTTHGAAGRQLMVDSDGQDRFVSSERCKAPWAFSVHPNPYQADLSATGARVTVSIRQTGGRKLHLIIQIPGDQWFIGEQTSDGSGHWQSHEFKLSELTWRYFNIILIRAEEKRETPSLERIEEIGFTDLSAGDGPLRCTRVGAIEVFGQKVPRARPKPRTPVGQKIQRRRAEPDLPKNVTAHDGIFYSRYGERKLRLDLYVPEGRGPFPAIVFIHGGGWYKGDPSSYTPMAMKLAGYGYVTANIEYRLSGEAPFPAALHDCKAAVRWLRAHADEYRIDLERVGSVGGSAGGHLSGLLGTSGPVEKLEGDGGSPEHSSALQACCVMAGSMDLASETAQMSARSDPRRRMITFMGGTWEEARQNYIDASPIQHVNSETPPMLFMDGQFDRPGERYVEIRRKLDALGIYSEGHVIENGPHPFWSSHPFFDPAVELLKKFFDRTLKSNSA